MPVTPDPAEPLLVACLCAAWCRTCDEYEPMFEGLQHRFGKAARFVWVDIEDEDEAMGPVDVENFPTLLIAHPRKPTAPSSCAPVTGSES